jgi:uncharacterized 2Fe-2S/4Fe-4S cluster protein (DUF4445 family)
MKAVAAAAVTNAPRLNEGLVENFMNESPNDRSQNCHVALMPSGRQGYAPRGVTLLKAAQELGVEIESICGGKETCGKCQVIVEEGSFPKHGIASSHDHLSPLTSREQEYFAEHGIHGRRFSCAAHVEGDLLITVPEESQARKQIIAKAASDRVIEVDPALRLVYVEVAPPELGVDSGDWERLAHALETQWELTNLSIDSKTLTTLQPTLRQGGFAVTVTLWQDREVLRVQPGYQEGLYGLAVDIGSTTIVAHLCDLRTGQVLATQAAMNPQVRYGEDLMSRVSYANSEPQGLARLHRGVIQTLNELAEKAAQDAGLAPQDILDAVLVGNSVMHHILLNIHPRELGAAPFALAVDTSVDLKARDLGLNFHPAARVHTLPLIAGHVGADHVAVLLAEAPHEQDDYMLIVDVGTNAELALGNRQGVLAASSPTGPAFEGAQIIHGQRAAPGAVERVRIDPLTLEPQVKIIGSPDWLTPGAEAGNGARATGICGSGIIEAVAEMYLAGILSPDGRFSQTAAARTPRIGMQGKIYTYTLVDATATATGAPLVITQSDVRNIQLAKAALYAGAKLLMNQLGIAQVDRIVLAGAFGSFISPLHALILGLIPDCPLEKISAVGNAAGDGARIALLNRSLRLRAEDLARWVRHVATPLEASFQDEFVAALGLPHSRDPYPTLQTILPQPAEQLRLRRHPRI